MPMNFGKCSHPTVFTNAKEELFVHYLIFLAEFGMLITRNELKICVKNYVNVQERQIPGFRNYTPGKD